MTTVKTSGNANVLSKALSTGILKTMTFSVRFRPFVHTETQYQGTETKHFLIREDFKKLHALGSA